MLAVFCLRLAAGMIACLLILPARLINPRFFRTHFQTAVGLVGLSWYFAAFSSLLPGNLALTLQLLFFASLVLTFAGSVVWSLEGSPGGKLLIVLSALTLAAGLGLCETGQIADHLGLGLLGSYTSAALLGAALTAMLMGHSYLIAPAMSLTPLFRLLFLLLLGLLGRMAVDGVVLWRWTSTHSVRNLNNEALLMLPVRWGVGYLLPLILVWMAWQTTKIRSTQSATGILYVVVIFVFLGELISLLLRESGLTL